MATTFHWHHSGSAHIGYHHLKGWYVVCFFFGQLVVLIVGSSLKFSIFSARFYVGMLSVTPPGGQTTTMAGCITSTAPACPTGGRMHTPINSQTQPHLSLRTKCLSWPQTPSLPRWVNMYWKTQEDYQRWLPTNLNNDEQSINGKFSVSFYVSMHLFLVTSVIFYPNMW